MTFAKNTGVPVEKSRMEIDSLLAKHGATQRGFMADEEQHVARVFFTLAKRQIRLDVPLPKPDERVFTHDHNGYRRTADKAKGAHEQGMRTRWRVFLLFIKAKLELIGMGVSSVEREFLADIALADGRTVYETLQAPLEKSYTTGAPLLPPAPPHPEVHDAEILGP